MTTRRFVHEGFRSVWIPGIHQLTLILILTKKKPLNSLLLVQCYKGRLDTNNHHLKPKVRLSEQIL